MNIEVYVTQLKSTFPTIPDDYAHNLINRFIQSGSSNPFGDACDFILKSQPTNLQTQQMQVSPQYNQNQIQPINQQNNRLFIFFFFFSK
jgi:hypothetical protein